MQSLCSEGALSIASGAGPEGVEVGSGGERFTSASIACVSEATLALSCWISICSREGVGAVGGLGGFGGCRGGEAAVPVPLT